MTDFVPDITSAGSISPPFDETASVVGSIEESIYYLLFQNTGLTDLISTKIYPAIVPQNGTLPCLTYQQISGNRDQEISGASGFVTARYQINCWAKTYSETRQLANEARLSLTGQSGWINGVYIHCIQLENESDMPQIDAENEVISRYGKRLDFQVYFAE